MHDTQPKSPPQVAARAPRAMLGIILQAGGFFLVWGIRPHRAFSASVPRNSASMTVLAASAILAVASLVLVFVSIRYLGRHWAIQARTVEGHTLVTTGPYGLVRHPIYLGMGGFLVAIGLVLAPWWALALACVFYLVGAQIRIRAEDALMASTFGEAFEVYRKRVPALIPFTRAA